MSFLSKAFKKVFGGGSHKSVAPTPAVPAVPVSAPNQNVEQIINTDTEATNVRAKGKKKLTIPTANASTGVNL